MGDTPGAAPQAISNGKVGMPDASELTTEDFIPVRGVSPSGMDSSVITVNPRRTGNACRYSRTSAVNPHENGPQRTTIGTWVSVSVPIRAKHDGLTHPGSTTRAWINQAPRRPGVTAMILKTFRAFARQAHCNQPETHRTNYSEGTIQ